jgi:hypothetical protein
MNNNYLLKNIVNWVIEHFQDRKGFFYYQKHKYIINKISYMRWAQAWAFYALSTYYVYLNKKHT